MSRLPYADAIVISCCWSIEEKHQLLESLAPYSTAPVFCLNESRHGCCACMEADRFDPRALVATIQQRLGIPATPAFPAAAKPAVATAAMPTAHADQPRQSAQIHEMDASQPPKTKPSFVHPKGQAKAAG